MCYSTKKRTLIPILLLILVSVPVTFAQTKKRLIPFPDWSLDNRDEKPSLELVEIRIAGKAIALDEPFKANQNWLKSMTLRIRNIGTKPIVAFGVGGGLLSGIAEELPAGASFQYGVSWNWGSISILTQKSQGAPHEARETVELSYENVDSLTRRVL